MNTINLGPWHHKSVPSRSFEVGGRDGVPFAGIASNFRIVDGMLIADIELTDEMKRSLAEKPYRSISIAGPLDQ